MKQCIVCGTQEVKNPNKDWHKGPTCKKCYGRKKARENYASDPEKIKAKNKKWVNANKQQVNSINRIWISKNLDKVKFYNDNAKQYKAAYYQNNKDKYQKMHAEYFQLNKKQIITKKSFEEKSV